MRMKRIRLVVLLLILLASLIAFYYDRQSKVRVETVQFKSDLIGKTLPYSVVLPPGYGLITGRNVRYPALYLLHGWNGHYSSWLERTSLAQYAAQYQLIIVTPEGDNGWYTDSMSVASNKYETYFLQELIPDVDRRYRTIKSRAGRAVVGVSMGGYGALKFGFKYPDQFTFAGSMSGALDAATRTDDASIMQTFGPLNSSTRAANDLNKLARDFPSNRLGALPFFYLDCGTDDPWLTSNRELANIFLEQKIVHEYRQLPGGHIWPYWDKQVQEVLRIAVERMLPPQA